MRRFASLALLLVGALAAEAVAEEPVYFADAGLKAAVEQALGVSNPTPTDMLRLTSLTADNKGIASLTGLEHATNLQSLGLWYNQISDLSPLSGLTNLLTLELDSNHISDLSPLSGLTKLQMLGLGDTQISDLSPLAGLTNLLTLGLGDTQISDLSTLSGMTNLQSLYLSDNRISDIAPLLGMTKLQELYLSDNRISDIAPLLGMTKLLSLHLDHNPLDRDAYCDLQAILLGSPSLHDFSYKAPNEYSPGGVSATDGTYDDKVAIKWDALCPGPGGPVTFHYPGDTFYYIVCRSTSLGGAKQAISGWLNGTSFDDTTASPGVHYWYWVNSDNTTEFSDADEGWRSMPGRTLTITSTAGGSVTTPGEGQFQYTQGTAVSIVATAEANHHFANWTGTAVDAEKVANPLQAQTTVTMDGDYTLQASFAIDQRTLVVSSTSGGSVSTPGMGSFQYPHGSTVAVAATPGEGYHFGGWTGTAVDAGKVADPSLAGTTVTMGADYSLQANFAINTYTLTVSATNGSVTRTPDKATYTHGEMVTLQATANTNYHFAGWSVDLSGSTNPVAITMDGNKTVTASFAVNPWTLTISSTAGGSVISPGEGAFQYSPGEQVALQAQADPLFKFVGWRGGIFSSSNPDSVTMNADYTVKACFESVLDVLYVDDNAPGDPGPGDPNVSDPHENGTPEHPFDMIQEAIDVAKDRAKVVVRPGTYLETIDLLGKSIEVKGLNSDDPNIVAFPVIDGQGKDTVVRCTQREDPNCILDGFVITGGRGRLAGGILCAGSCPSIVNCLIVGNRATDPHGDGGAGGIYCQDSNAVFLNCTIAGNYGGTKGAGLWFKDSKAVVTNSIIWGNTPAEVLAAGSIQPVIGYTDAAGGWTGLGSMDADPLFAMPGYWANPSDLTKAMTPSDPTAVWVPGDYHLKSVAGRWDPVGEKWIMDALTSPCIDAGDPALCEGAEPMPNGERINMGAYGGTSQASLSSAK